MLFYFCEVDRSPHRTSLGRFSFCLPTHLPSQRKASRIIDTKKKDLLRAGNASNWIKAFFLSLSLFSVGENRRSPSEVSNLFPEQAGSCFALCLLHSLRCSSISLTKRIERGTVLCGLGIDKRSWESKSEDRRGTGLCTECFNQPVPPYKKHHE